tara:strand:- start:2623 stop:3621 length:999 start_codon:yes stop_codon:yes gene_type:complete
MNYKIDYKNLVISILLILAAGYIYDKFKINVENSDKKNELNIIKKYLLNEQEYNTIDNLSSIKKPILWVHVEYKQNSRKWSSFGSRNSTELNQDYLYLTIRSIINKCNDYFHIVLIDDDSFEKLLPDWNVEINKISDPHKSYVRTLALCKVLYNYGGLLIENSFILFKSLKPIYDKILETNKMCVAEFSNNSSNSHIMNFMPSTKFIGCVKNCQKMHEFGKHLEILVNQDFTNETIITDLINKWLYSSTQNEEINYIDGTFIGTKDSDNKMIGLDRLLGSSYLDLNINSYGLYIPREELLKRHTYNWFVHLNVQNILESNTNIAKYLLLSNN